MESADAATELLENVVISDGPAAPPPQFMIQRLPENAQLLGSELLQQQNGLVVDLGGADFIPVTYSSEALLSQDLTEEDRNLAAALVAVQLSQHQKQQHLQEANALPSIVQTASLEGKMLEHHQPLILTEKDSSGYLQIVGSDNIYVGKQSVTNKLNRYNNTTNNHTNNTSSTSSASTVQKTANSTTNTGGISGEKSEDDSEQRHLLDSRTSRKSLPHKKRISRKLKTTKQPHVPIQVKAAVVKIQCSLCEQTFASHDEFAQHELLCQTTITPVHQAAPCFTCQLCTATFQDQLRFFEHLKSHYEPNVAPQAKHDEAQNGSGGGGGGGDVVEKDNIFSSLLSLTCIQCNKTFRRQKAFESHMRDAHHKEELNEFSETEDLMEGINVVVDAGDANSSSDTDTKAWYREDELHQTEEDLKELEAGSHECHICKQPFPVRAILLQHLVTCRATSGHTEPTAHGVVKKRNKKKGSLHCSECDRVFTHRNSLVYHMRSHTGVRPHQCDQCGKSFFASSALKVHLRMHSGDKPYTCEECGKKFRQWGDLKYHTTSIHSTEKQFQCEYCGKDFARKYSLIIHRRIHTGEKNYKCEYCGKSFRASSYLRNHRRIHTGEKPHECDICGKPFRVKSDMKRHQKTHSKRTTAGKPVRYVQDLNTDEVVKTETIIGRSVDEDLYELNVQEVDGAEDAEAGQILGYERTEEDEDPLEAAKESGTLYQGQQLYLVSYADVPVRSVEASTWIPSN